MGDGSWPIKCTSTWNQTRQPPPPPPPPPPRDQSMTPPLPPLPPVAAPTPLSTMPIPPPVLAGQDQFYGHAHSFVAHGVHLKGKKTVLESLPFTSLISGSYELQKVVPRNSFLSLLSGGPRMAQLQANDNGSVIHGMSFGDPVTQIPPSPHKNGNDALKKWNELSSFVASKQFGNSTFLKPPQFSNNQISSSSHDIGSGNPAFHQAPRGCDTSFAVNATASGWPTIVRPAKLNVLASQKVPSSTKSSNPCNLSAFPNGHPRVFCSNTVGELFMSDMGLFGVICLCHGSHMSMAKFCEHAGLPSSSPGESVHLESGMTISEWCKHCLGKTVAPVGSNKWDRSEGSLVNCALVGPKATSFTPSSDNIAKAAAFVVSNESQRSLETSKSFCSNYAVDVGGCLIPEKSGKLIKDQGNAHQNNEFDITSCFREVPPEAAKITKSALTKKQIMNPVQQSHCIPDNACSTIYEESAVLNHHTSVIDASNKGNGAVHHISHHPSLVKSLSHGHDANNSKVSVEESQVDKYGATSTVELRLGQPSYVFAGSVSPSILQFGSSSSSERQQILQQLGSNIHVTNARNTKKAKSNRHFTSDTSDSGRSNVLHDDGTTKVGNHSKEEHTCDATKNSLISLFLSHLEGNDTSHSLDNSFMNNECYTSRVANDDTLCMKFNYSDSLRDVIDSFGGTSSPCQPDPSRFLNSKVLKPTDDPKISNSDQSTDSGRPAINRKCPKFSSFVDYSQSPFHRSNLSWPMQEPCSGSSNQCSKASFLLNRNSSDNAILGSSGRATHATIGPFPMSSDIPMNLSSAAVSFSNENLQSGTLYSERKKLFMDEKLKAFSLSHKADFSRAGVETISHELNPENQRLCFLHSRDHQGHACQETSAFYSNIPCKGHCCSSHMDISKLALKSVYSCTSRQSACVVDSIIDHSGHPGPKRLCSCTGVVSRVPLHREQQNESISACCTHVANDRPCLRLENLPNNCITDGCKHEICSHKEKVSYLPGQCCFSLHPCRSTGCCLLGADITSSTLNEQRLCAQGMHATLNNEEYSIPDYKRNRLAFNKGVNDGLMALNEETSCGQAEASHVGGEKECVIQDFRTRSARCNFSKNNCFMKNDQHHTFWRPVPEKSIPSSDASLTNNITQTLETMKMFDDRPLVTASKELGSCHEVPKSIGAQLISNVSSGSSTPVITEISVRGTKITSKTHVVDEGSGIEKCGSSDEAAGSRGCDDAFTSMGKVDPPKSAFHFQQSDSSDYLNDDNYFERQSKAKRPKNQNRERATEAYINKSLDFDTTIKESNREESIVKNTSSALSDMPRSHSKVPDMVHSSDPSHLLGEEGEVFPDADEKMQTTKFFSRSSQVKRKRSGLSSNKSNCIDILKIQDEVPEINQLLEIDSSIRRSEASDEKKPNKALAGYSKQENHIFTGKPRKYMSLNHIVNSAKGDKANFAKIKRPIVCGDSGILSNGGIIDLEKPVKLVSLSLILKKAKRCTPFEYYEPGSTGFSDFKCLEFSDKEDYNELFPKLPPENKEPCPILRNESNAALSHNSLDVRKSSSTNGRTDSRLLIGKEKGPRSERSLQHGSNRLVSQAQPPHGDVHSLRVVAGKDKEESENNCLAPAREDIFSDVNKSGHLGQFLCSSEVESKLCPSEFSEGVSATIGRSSINSDIKQEHAGKLSQTSPGRCCKGKNSFLDLNVLCCVCGSSNRDDSNQLVECSACLIRVHQACYGVPRVPKGHWFCRPCKIDAKNTVCVLCGYGGGAMTRAVKSQNIVKSLLKAWNLDMRCGLVKSGPSSEPRNDELLQSSLVGELLKSEKSNLGLGSLRAAVKMDFQVQGIGLEHRNGDLEYFKDHNSIIAGIFNPSIIQWVHMVCGLWTPGTRCPNVDTMSTFDVSGASTAKKIVCSICNQTGGSCIVCRVPNCFAVFHPWCAHQKGLLQSETEGDDNEKVGFYGRCLHHATLSGLNLENHPKDPEEVNPINKGWMCARTEVFKGRKREGCQLNNQKPCKDNGGCLVSQDQINAWLHINGQRLITRGVVKPFCSDIEYDLRKEYMRYKQSKGWKHLVVYKSGIHALGLYTSRFIARGAMVVEYVGEVVGLRVADKREMEYQSGRRTQYKSACYFFRINKEHIIDATRKGGIARFVNHSCLPNCVAKVISVRNEKKVVFFAERDINPGEEITYDYHFNSEDEGEKIPCFCGSKNCRRFLN